MIGVDGPPVYCAEDAAGAVLGILNQLRAGSSLQVLMSAMRRRSVELCVASRDGSVSIEEDDTTLCKLVWNLTLSIAHFLRPRGPSVDSIIALTCNT